MGWMLVERLKVGTERAAFSWVCGAEAEGCVGGLDAVERGRWDNACP
jgi:hypothetical protein